MIFTAVDPKAKTKGDEPAASYNADKNRVVLNKKAIRTILDHAPITRHVKYLADSEDDSIFWIQPCDKNDKGQRAFTVQKNSSVSLHTSKALANMIGLKSVSRPGLKAAWDESINALKIEIF